MEQQNTIPEKRQIRYGISFWKIVFTFVIIFHHMITLPKGYIYVDFFFLASGFFLYKTCKSKQKTTWQYTKNRVKNLYFDYIIAFALLAIFGTIFSFVKFDSVFHFFAEILMLQNIGIPFATGGINYPAWFVSVLVTASPIIYFCAKRFDKKVYNAFAIFAVVAIFSTLIVVCGRLEYWTNIAYIFYPPWLRGFADILLGTLVAQLAEKFEIKNKVFAIVTECILFVAIVLLTLCKIEILDFVSPVLFSVLLFVSNSELSLSHKIGSTKTFAFLSKYEYVLYLNQALVIYSMRDVAMNESMPLWIKIIILPIAFVLLYILICLIHNGTRKLKNLLVQKIKKPKQTE